MNGDPDARYTVIEYSDLECPFCKKHHQNGTLKNLVAQFPEDVNHVFRHFPLNNIHPNVQLAGEAAECAGDLEGSDGFFTYIDEVFKL
jgi:protein-disulfide isomerase